LSGSDAQASHDPRIRAPARPAVVARDTRRR
jgi:hypothetical protein